MGPRVLHPPHLYPIYVYTCSNSELLLLITGTTPHARPSSLSLFCPTPTVCPALPGCRTRGGVLPSARGLSSGSADRSSHQPLARAIVRSHMVAKVRKVRRPATLDKVDRAGFTLPLRHPDEEQGPDKQASYYELGKMGPSPGTNGTARRRLFRNLLDSTSRSGADQ